MNKRQQYANQLLSLNFISDWVPNRQANDLIPWVCFMPPGKVT